MFTQTYFNILQGTKFKSEKCLLLVIKGSCGNSNVHYSEMMYWFSEKSGCNFTKTRKVLVREKQGKIMGYFIGNLEP